MLTKIFDFEYYEIKEVRVIYKLKKKRKEKGWTQLKLSEKSGVPQPTISQIEKGNRKYPTHENIRKLAKALEVDIRELEDENESATTV